MDKSQEDVRCNDIEDKVNEINGRLRNVEINFSTELGKLQTKLENVNSRLGGITKLLVTFVVGVSIAVIVGIVDVLIRVKY